MIIIIRAGSNILDTTIPSTPVTQYVTVAWRITGAKRSTNGKYYTFTTPNKRRYKVHAFDVTIERTRKESSHHGTLGNDNE